MGEGYVDRWTLFENKKIGGIYFHHWKTIKQDRFHTHAFDGIVWLISGGYVEERIENGVSYRKTIKPGLRFIPKDYNHKILQAEPWTFSLLVAGPWAQTWTEENDIWKRVLSWNREVLFQTLK